MTDPAKGPIKNAFQKVRQDMDELQANIIYLNDRLEELKDVLFNIQSEQLKLTQLVKIHSNRPTDTSTDKQTGPSTGAAEPNPAHFPTQNTSNQTIQQENPAHKNQSPQIPTDNMPLEALKTSNYNVSSGNRGVPTDKQTDKPTDRQQSKTENLSLLSPNTIVTELVNSLDNIRKEVRIKFKHLTKQEMQVFSTIYQLEDQGFIVDYPLLASKLSLSESSIRDYTQRIIKKGIPLIKVKENNKKIILSISPDLKKIASLAALHQLRESQDKLFV